MSALPPPADLTAAPRDLVGELCTHWEERRVVAACADLLAGAAPAEHSALLPYLAGRPGAAYPGPGWAEHWPRVWGARALLYVWDDLAAPAVAAGTSDPAWRVAEMCLKVAARRELPVGDTAVALTDHALARVRVAALRALGAAGDVEHVDAVVRALDDDDEQVRRTADRALDAMAARLDVPRP